MVPFKVNGQKIHQSVQLIDLNSPCLSASFFSSIYCSFWCKWVLNILLSTDIFSYHLKKNGGYTQSYTTCELWWNQIDRDRTKLHWTLTLRKQLRMSNISNFIFSSAEHRRYCRFLYKLFFFRLSVKMKFVKCNR